MVIFEETLVNEIQETYIKQADVAAQIITTSIWSDTPEFTEFVDEIDFSETASIDIDPLKCLPVFAVSDSSGNIQIIFNHDIAFEIDKDQILDEITASGAI